MTSSRNKKEIKKSEKLLDLIRTKEKGESMIAFVGING
jgi:hypothetical protein